MKTRIRNLMLFLIIAALPLLGLAQDVREDVVYLKNGTVYRGLIVEQVFNESVTIEVHDGVKHKVLLNEVEKMTKEKVIDGTQPIPASREGKADQPRREGKEKPEFHYPAKRFFFQGEAILGYVNFGARIVGGYKFGQVGMLGLGAGVDAFSAGLAPNNLTTDPFQGTYFPVYVYYSGDILKKRLTPFYDVEAGYAFRVSPPSNNSYIILSSMNHPVYSNQGGLAGAASMGLRVYSRRKLYASFAFGVDIKSAKDKYSNYYYNSSGEYISVSYSSFAIFFVPAFKVNIGF